MRISRHRMTLLLELSALERALTGPERMLREQLDLQPGELSDGVTRQQLDQFP